MTLDELTPPWPPEIGAKVLPEAETADPGPSYVVSEPYESKDGIVVDILPHHRVAPNAAEGVPQRALDLYKEGSVEARTIRLDHLKYYTGPECQRCGDWRTMNRPVEVSVGGEQSREWLCVYCYGYRQGQSDAEGDA